MTTCRLNLSHGSLKENLKLISNYRQARRLRPHKNCAFLLELKGREIRISHSADKSKTIRVRTGSTVAMFGGEFKTASDPTNLRVNNESFQRYMKPNEVVYIDDGKAIGIVIQINENGVLLEIKQGGTIRENC